MLQHTCSTEGRTEEAQFFVNMVVMVKILLISGTKIHFHLTVQTHSKWNQG